MNQDDIISCPFCGPNIATAEFAGTAQFAAIYNVAPILPGHSLVIPRRHIKSMYELDQDEFARFWLFAREITSFLGTHFETDAFDWTIQEQEAAGQSVPHLHLHVIPRKVDDLPTPGGWYGRLRGRNGSAQNGNEIDSKDRERLSEVERSAIVADLRADWDASRSSTE